MSEYLNFKKSNCKNCYKCIRHCPVKAIKFSGNQAHIVSKECILCGRCFVVCPQNAKQIADGTEIAWNLLNGEVPVVASVAPSFVAYFEGVGINSLSKALQKLGFYMAEETAIGATIVKRQYEKQIEEGRQDVIISSCCHSVNLLIEKYYPELIKYISPVVTPMVAHSINIKERMPNVKTIFIGPCLSKKDEAEISPVDSVITFDELSRMFLQKGIEPEKVMDSEKESKARFFPTVGGILKTMDIKDTDYTCMTVDGTENCLFALDDILSGNVHKCFIEMSACSGSCIGGPVMEKYKNSPIRHFKAVTSYAGSQDFNVFEDDISRVSKRYSYIDINCERPSPKQIEEVLSKMGKTKPEDELNCGSCGYETCRKKAEAVCMGKADINMCLPYLMDKTERFSDNILNNTPNGIIAINEDLEVQRINKAAMQILNVRNESDILGSMVVSIMDPIIFMDVIDNKTVVKNKMDYYAELKKYLEMTVVHDKTTHILIVILRDVTSEEEARLKKERISMQTVETADKVVDKQMRIVQEIASLLGETAAETKIALTKLKESITDAQDGE